MKLAITVWGERVSPVFDSARTLLIAHIKNRKVTTVSFEPFDARMEAGPADKLNLLDVKVLICGAISKNDSALIESRNIRLVPFISGDVNQILELFARGNSLIPRFLMPGCGVEGPGI